MTCWSILKFERYCINIKVWFMVRSYTSTITAKLKENIVKPIRLVQQHQLYFLTHLEWSPYRWTWPYHQAYHVSTMSWKRLLIHDFTLLSRIYTLGSGSDFDPFIIKTGIPCAHTYYYNDKNVRPFPVYHTVYETFQYMDEHMDPRFAVSLPFLFVYLFIFHCWLYKICL